MPYLKLSSVALPLETKRALAGELTQATLTALHRPASDAERTTVHFAAYAPEDVAIAGRLLADGQESDYTLEFSERNLTPQAKRQLVDALLPVLMQHLGLGANRGDAFKVNIIFRPYAAEDMAIGGRFLPELEREHRTL